MNELAINTKVMQIIAARQHTLQLLEQGFNTLAQAAEQYKVIAGGGGCRSLFGNLKHSDWYAIEGDGRSLQRTMKDLTQHIDAVGWSHMMTASGLRQMMDATAIKDMEKQLLENPAELNESNLRATLAAHYENRHQTFLRGLVKAFTHLSRNYRTNEAFKIGAKIIIERAIPPSDYTSGWQYHWSGSMGDTIVDIERIFCILDDKPVPEYKHTAAFKLMDATRHAVKPPLEQEHAYFSFKLYKNGNLHFAFTQPDLVDECNRLIAEFYGNALADDRNRRR